MRTIVAVDIGSTRLRAAAYKQDELQPLTQKRVETKASEPDTFGRLISLLEDIWPKNETVNAIGVSSPGPLDPHTGIIMSHPNIKEWRDFPITQKLDELSIEAYKIAGKYLGVGVANFRHAFDPSMVIFGGGVSQSGPLLFDSFESSLKESVIHPRYLEGLVITKAARGDDAGLLGARCPS